MEETSDNFLTLGSINGPHIQIIARKGHEEKVSIRDAINLLTNASTIWRPNETIATLLSPEELQIYKDLKLDDMTGFHGYMEENVEEDEPIVPVIVLFFYPPTMNAEEALRLIEFHQKGVFSPSLAIGLLAIASFFDQAGLYEQAMHLGYIFVGGIKPVKGMSYLSDESIVNKVKKCLTEVTEKGASIETCLPDGAVDRARFMVTLGKYCWNPEIRGRIVKGGYQNPELASIFLLAASWYYLHPLEDISVAGIDVPFIRNSEQLVDPWIQVMEWDSHPITPKTVEFLLPEGGEPFDGVELDVPINFPKYLVQVASELAKILIIDKRKLVSLPTKYYRVRLPQLPLFEQKRLAGLRISISLPHERNAAWVGVETPMGVSSSFFWKCQNYMPQNWMTKLMVKDVRSILHLTLVALWHDLHMCNEVDLPFLEKEHFTGVGIRSWGSENEIERIQNNTADLLTKIRGNELPMIVAMKIYDLATHSFDPNIKIVGRACLTLFLGLIDLSNGVS